MMRWRSSIGLEEEGDEPADEAVEEARLGEREAEPLVALDVAAQLRLPGLGRDRGAEDATDTGTGARGATACACAERDRAARVLALLDAGVGQREQRVEDREEVKDQH